MQRQGQPNIHEDLQGEFHTMAKGSMENGPSPCELQQSSSRRTITPLGRCCKCTTMSRCITS
eukprot:3738830-Ditylum_brightwellii.AAC.1